MKKLIFILTLTLVTVFSFTAKVSADDDGNIDLYPYGQEACLLAEDECMNTKLGDSHWSFVYAGHHYYIVRGGARYATEWVDANADGFIDASEIPPVSWNAFAAININDTAAPVVLTTTNVRADLTTVVHRKYAHFDEAGVLQMFEDHVSTYYIFNDGSEAVKDWRLATQAEIDAYEALADDDARAADLTMRKTHIRMALDDVDTDGYVLEPLGWINWINADVDTVADPDVTHWSTIIAGDPNNVTIPAGWTVVSFGTLDRGSSNPLTTDYILSLPAAMADPATEPMTFEYDNQPGWFNLSSVDDDLATAGVQMVVEYNSVWDLPTTIEAKWRNMFDDTTDKIINQVDMIDFEVVISQNDVDLETITMTWNSETSSYDQDAAVTVVDTAAFAEVYTATYRVTTPEGDIAEATAEIVVGVLPPTYTGVADRYIDEGNFIDLMEGITADDGYGNNVTSTIALTAPEGFNFYSPLPGSYTMDLTFTHHVHFDGIDPTINLNGSVHIFDGSVDPAPIGDVDSTIAVYYSAAALQANTYGWGSSGVMIEVDGSGNVIRTINRHTWDLVDVNGVNTPANASGMFDAWLSGLTLETDGYVMIIGYKLTSEYADARDLAYGDPVSYDLTTVPVFDYDIITNESYVLNVDDITAPHLLVVNSEYTISVDEFDNVNEAILSNVAAFDAYSDTDDLTIYVSNNGGLSLDTPGSYNVAVTVADEAGNTDVRSFTVILVEVPDTDAEIQALIDASTRKDAEIQALIDASVRTDAEIQALIDAAIDDIPEPATGCGSSLALGTAIVFGVMALGGAALFKIKKTF